MTPIIQTRGLTKLYGATRALNQLDLSVQQGEIFGYLGPNGAGKTTTIKLLLDLIRPSAGNATLFGLDARRDALAIHQRIGFLPAELNLWKNLTAAQTVRHLAEVRGAAKTHIEEAQTIAERLKLDLSKKVRDFSTGNKRKLGLVLALMSKPALLILDEPTSGLDPLMQQTFNQMMREIRAEGRTVFLSSHLLSEVQAICDRVGILRDGVLRAIETVEQLTHVDFRWVQLKLRDGIPSDWQARLGLMDGISEVSIANGTSVRFKLMGDFDPLLRFIGDVYVQDIHVEDPTLEEIFLAFYGNGTTQAGGN